MIISTGLCLITELPANPWEIVAMIRPILGVFFLMFLAGGIALCFGYSMHGFAFNLDGSISKHVVIIPAIFFTGMSVFFYMCISELKEANENLTVIASKVNTLNQSIVAVNQNIVAIYKENKGK